MVPDVADAVDMQLGPRKVPLRESTWLTGVVATGASQAASGHLSMHEFSVPNAAGD
jgi:hypothetical protein